ncbi:uncharacterized protein LOC106421488 [Brassica napus]|nr:uncharacterized protein LOC106421488 [Brassica napus]
MNLRFHHVNYRRIFAIGEEPSRVRVTAYRKPCALRHIFNALDPDEVERIRGSQFGRLLEIADKPSFSGRFGRYIISRQLKVSKKHEAWFVFAEKPIRFSLREFAIVTGLNCGRFAKRSKKRCKSHITEKPYWGELFGTLKEVPVSSVVRMLQKKTVNDKEIRLKYAYLSLLAAVILPTTHTPRISHDQAELIKDLDAFLAFPRGRVSFDMLMTSIKERKEDGSSSGSEDESGEADGDILDDDKSDKKSIHPGHARDIDSEGKAVVHSIIPDDNNIVNTADGVAWSDDKDETIVENLVNLVEERFPFSQTCFPGGVSIVEAFRMRDEAKAEAVNRKNSKPKATSSTIIQEGVDPEFLASMVRDKMKGDVNLLDAKISKVDETLISFQAEIIESLKEIASKIDAIVVKMTLIGEDQPSQYYVSAVNAGTQTTEDISTIINNAGSVGGDGVRGGYDKGVNGVDTLRGTNELERNHQFRQCDQSKASAAATAPGQSTETAPVNRSEPTLAPALIFPKPTFSLGLTQDHRIEMEAVMVVVSLHWKVVVKTLVLKQSSVTTLAGTVDSDELYGIVERSTSLSAKFVVIYEHVVDVLINHISSLFHSLAPANQKTSCVFLDTEFISMLSKTSTKFSKVLKKVSFKFPSNVVASIPADVAFGEADRFYFPFNLDKKNWVAICVDCTSWTLSVLDCNISLRSDQMMIKEVGPLAQMFPFLLTQMGKQCGCREGKPMAVDRLRSIPQHNTIMDSGVASVLFILAHAVAGVEACKCITSDVITTEVERLLVTLYEGNVGPL